MSVGRTALVEYYGVSLVLVLSTVLLFYTLASLSIVYLVLYYKTMTRADTADRTNILQWRRYVPQLVLQHNRFYGTGYMLVILFRSNITVDYLHYGILSTTALSQ